MDSVLDFLIELVKQAGSNLLMYQHDPQLKLDKKFDQSLVTEADIETDNLIVSSIKKRFSNDQIISEELFPTSSFVYSIPTWIIDPLDGTTNFALGLKYWGISIAYVQTDVAVTAVNYYPALNEMYTAQAGEGAFLNSNRLEIDSRRNINRISFFSCCSRTLKNYHLSVPYKARIFGCASYSMCCVTTGIAKTSFEAQAKLWDIAGSFLILQEAGCIMDVLDGPKPFPLSEKLDYNKQPYPIIAAADYQTLDKCKKWITPLPNSPRNSN